MTKFVYLIESECGRIKLGSSFEPEKRLAIFSSRAARPLRLIAMWPGSQSDELQLHKRFSSYRRHNEWFEPVGEFGEFVAGRRGLGLTAIAEWPSSAWGDEALRRKAKLSAAQKSARADPVWKAEQAANRAWRKTLREAERMLGRELTSIERRDLSSLSRHAP